MGCDQMRRDGPGPGVPVRKVSVAGSCMAVKAEPREGAGPSLVWTTWPWDTPTLGRIS